MGVSIEEWRSRIGCFVRRSRQKCTCTYKNIQYIKSYTRCHMSLVFFVICMLLAIGGIEQNPGPDTVELIKSEIQKSNETLITQLTNTIIASKNETIKVVNEVKARVDGISAELESVKTQLSKANDRISSLESCKTELLNKIDDLENKSKKNNIIIFGLTEIEDGNEPIDDFLLLAGCKLDVNLDKNCVSHAYRIGKNFGKRPLLVSFIQYSSKEIIMKNVGKLKGSKITISEDLSNKARAKRKNILVKAKEARDKGLNVKIRNNYLLVDNKVVTYDTLLEPDWLDQFIVTKSRSDSQATENKRNRDESSQDDEYSDTSIHSTKSHASQTLQGNAMPPPASKVGGASSSTNPVKKTRKSREKNKRGKHHH
jgi:hypothetical protein